MLYPDIDTEENPDTATVAPVVLQVTVAAGLGADSSFIDPNVDTLVYTYARVSVGEVPPEAESVGAAAGARTPMFNEAFG
jgi:hypothetical protein